MENMMTQQTQKNIGAEMVVSRQAQEVQAAMVVAKRFPRDEYDAVNRIMKACKRKTLAEQSHYTYPRGGEQITGPSIRLAEAIAQAWGNIDYGVIELDQTDGKSDMMAYAWDLETNTRSTKIFTVTHVRNTKKGSKQLTDGRDIYELSANMGARRVRSCILAIIPGDVVDMAEEECKKTLRGAYSEPLEERIMKMLQAFENEFSVDKILIEKYIGYVVTRFSEQDFIKLRGVYKSLKDGMAKREDYFDMKTTAVQSSESALEKRIEEESEGSDNELAASDSK
mgnify:CR=1 FL=1